MLLTHQPIPDSNMLPLAIRLKNKSVDEIKELFTRKLPEDVEQDKKNTVRHKVVFENYINVDFEEYARNIAEIKESIQFLKVAYDSDYAKKLAMEKEKSIEQIKEMESQKRMSDWTKPKPRRKI